MFTKKSIIESDKVITEEEFTKIENNIDNKLAQMPDSFPKIVNPKFIISSQSGREALTISELDGVTYIKINKNTKFVI